MSRRVSMSDFEERELEAAMRRHDLWETQMSNIDTDSLLHAPWTDEQVDALNRWQKNDVFHPFTCPGDHPERALVATKDGWRCQVCDYTQDWAHRFMVVPL